MSTTIQTPTPMVAATAATSSTSGPMPDTIMNTSTATVIPTISRMARFVALTMTLAPIGPARRAPGRARRSPLPGQPRHLVVGEPRLAVEAGQGRQRVRIDLMLGEDPLDEFGRGVRRPSLDPRRDHRGLEPEPARHDGVARCAGLEGCALLSGVGGDRSGPRRGADRRVPPSGAAAANRTTVVRATAWRRRAPWRARSGSTARCAGRLDERRELGVLALLAGRVACDALAVDLA